MHGRNNMKKYLLLLILILIFSISFIVIYADPDTATLDDPTEDGDIEYDVEYWDYTRDKDGNVIGIGFYVTYYIERGYIEWDISDIPDGATITDVVFKYHGSTNEIDCHIHECVGQRPSTAGTEALYNELGQGTVYADPAGFPEVGTNKQVDLGASAVSDLQSQLSVDWFAIGIQADDEGLEDTRSKIYSEEYVATPDPTLYVEYTLPSEINVIFFSTPY